MTIYYDLQRTVWVEVKLSTNPWANNPFDSVEKPLLVEKYAVESHLSEHAGTKACLYNG